MIKKWGSIKLCFHIGYMSLVEIPQLSTAQFSTAVYYQGAAAWRSPMGDLTISPFSREIPLTWIPQLVTNLHWNVLPTPSGIFRSPWSTRSLWLLEPFFHHIFSSTNWGRLLPLFIYLYLEWSYILSCENLCYNKWSAILPFP